MSPSWGMGGNLGLSGFNKYYLDKIIPPPPPVGMVAHLRVDNRKLTPDDKFINIDVDRYDYRLIGVHRNIGYNQILYLGVNGDTSSKYINTYIEAQGTPSGGSYTSDMFKLSEVNNGGDAYDGFFEYYIDGASNKQTFFNGGAHLRSTSNNQSVINSMYWNDVSVPATEINLYDDGNNNDYDIDIWLFIKEKQQAFDGFTFLEEIDLTGSETFAEFTGLQGDTDLDYIIEIQNMSNATAFEPKIVINNDTGTNYANNIMRGDDVGHEGKTIDPDDCIRMIDTKADSNLAFYTRIHAISGSQRTVLSMSGNSDPEMAQAVGWWKDTDQEITSLKVTFPTGTTGKVRLYKTNPQDPYLFERINVDGVFNEGYEFTGLGGDDVLYEISACLVNKAGGAGAGKIVFNGDLGSNYRYIRLRSADNELTGAKGNTSRVFGAQCNNLTTGHTRVVMYNKVGRYRPIIARLSYYNGGYYFESNGQSWKNEIDDITAIKYYQDSTKEVKGFVELRRIQLPTANIMPI